MPSSRGVGAGAGRCTGTQGRQASGSHLPWCLRPAGCTVMLVQALPRPPALPRHLERTLGQCHEGQHVPVVV